MWIQHVSRQSFPCSEIASKYASPRRSRQASVQFKTEIRSLTLGVIHPSDLTLLHNLVYTESNLSDRLLTRSLRVPLGDSTQQHRE